MEVVQEFEKTDTQLGGEMTILGHLGGSVAFWVAASFGVVVAVLAVYTCHLATAHRRTNVGYSPILESAWDHDIIESCD